MVVDAPALENDSPGRWGRNVRKPAVPAPERLLALLDNFAGRRIALAGDLVCDEFVLGDIARVSREAPVLVLEHRQTTFMPGGAGNAAANLRALDAVPIPVGVLGKDEAGRRLARELARRGIASSGIVRIAGYATPLKSRIVAGGVHTRRQQIVRLDRGARRAELPRSVARALGARLERAAASADALLVADYGYGAGSPDVVSAGMKAARRRGMAVTVDSRSRVERFPAPLACTPNQEELESAAGRGPLLDDRAIEEAARRLLRSTRSEAVLVTRGARGMTLVEKRAAVRHIPAYGSGEVADVTGAGDTVIAVFTLALAAGGSFLEAALLANVAAGLVVMKYGTATVSRGELEAALASGVGR